MKKGMLKQNESMVAITSGACVGVDGGGANLNGIKGTSRTVLHGLMSVLQNKVIVFCRLQLYLH